MFLWGELEYMVRERQAEGERRMHHNRLLHVARQRKGARRKIFLRPFIRICESLGKRIVVIRNGLGGASIGAEKRVFDLRGESTNFAVRGAVEEPGQRIPASPRTSDCSCGAPG